MDHVSYQTHNATNDDETDLSLESSDLHVRLSEDPNHLPNSLSDAKTIPISRSLSSISATLSRALLASFV